MGARRAAVDAAVDQSTLAVRWLIGFIISKTCYLHMLVKDVKTNSNVRKALGVGLRTVPVVTGMTAGSYR